MRESSSASDGEVLANTRATGVPAVSFREALRVWTYVGLNSFGGPAGQIAVMHRVLVLEKRWISEERFLHALNYCMLLPGPEATQLAIYVGWLLHKTIGGLAAGILFVLPGVIAMLGLSAVYAAYGHVQFVDAIFYGIKPAVLAIVVEAVLRIGKRALKDRVMIALAVAAFLGIFVFDAPFPLIVGAAGLIGYGGGRVWPERFRNVAHASSTTVSGANRDVLVEEMPPHTRPSLRRALRIFAIGTVLWCAPLLALRASVGREHVFVQEGVFFSKTAVVTFGGAYAVLAYVAQRAVETFHWLRPGEMLDGLGLAETTPGPLILVVQFVGFLGAYRAPGALSPMLAGTIGAAITVWVTFVPCFLWIFLGAPYIEALRENRALNAALSAITAAIVGVVMNLAVWFALHTLFARVDEVHTAGMRLWVPEWATIDFAALAIACIAMSAMLRFKVGMLWTLAACAVLGLILH